MQQGIFTRLTSALGQSFGDVADYLSDAASFQELLAYLGWTATDLPGAYRDLATPAHALRDAVRQLPPAPSYADLAPVLQALQALLSALDALAGPLPAGISDPDFAAQFGKRLTAQLLADGTQRYLPALYYLLAVLGIIAPSTTYEGRQGRVFQLDALRALLSQPVSYLRRQLGWGETFVLTTQRLTDLANLATTLGAPAELLDEVTASSRGVGEAAALNSARNLLLLSLGQALPDGQQQFLSVLLQPTKVLTEVLVPEELDIDAVADGDSVDVPTRTTLSDELRFSLLPHIADAKPLQLGTDLALTLTFLQTLQDAFSFTLGPQGIRFADGSNVAFSSLTLDPAVVLAYAPPQPIIFIGEPDKTRLQADGLELTLALSVAHGVKLELRARNSVLIIDGDEGDSFVGNVLPKSTIAVPLSVALSSQDGLRFNGNNSFNIRTTPNQKVGPVLFQRLTLGMASTAQADVHLQAHADIAVTLGPVKVAASDLGVSFAIKELANPQDIALGFDLPKGIEIAVSSDLVNGGGYLFVDPAKHQYAGAATLTVKTGTREINLNALGLLQTQLPGKPDAYSLLLLLTAQFTPIDLGLGFTLSGLGGLVGVNRAANHEYLLGMVRQGQLKQLLFPANVMDDPAGALALIDGAFPATEGRYVIGLMAQLGWGSAANIITLDVALLVELPAPVRIVLLGVLQAVLPTAQNDKLKLRADFLGLVDFGAKKASFDATLTDSHILNFALTGDLAFRLYQGSNPLFVITAGGFHPAFQPPAGANLAGLKRLRLALAQGGDLQLQLDSYFAVTSNTVQFGAHLDLTYKIARGFRVEGHFGFDVLFQFSPFRLLAHVEAGVAIMRGNSELLSIHLSLDVSGPGPWHIWGEASFKIWFIKIGVNVNATIGASVAEPTLPAPDVHELLVKALNEPASWQVEAPTATQPASVLLRPVEAAAGQVFLDPRGGLSLRQRVAPLGLLIDKYGTAPTAPLNGQLFELTTLQVGQATYAAGTKGREELRDFFVPDQFTKLTDAQKLSAASFQQLPNGVRISSLNALVAAPRATRRIIEYERKDLLSGASGGSKRLGSDTYRQLARGSALGQAVRAALPSGRAAQPVNWQEDTYEVVYAATLNAYPTALLAPLPFRSQAEAEQYRQQQDAPADLLVMASHELVTA
jgi:hypothetical protein